MDTSEDDCRKEKRDKKKTTVQEDQIVNTRFGSSVAVCHDRSCVFTVTIMLPLMLAGSICARRRRRERGDDGDDGDNGTGTLSPHSSCRTGWW